MRCGSCDKVIAAGVAMQPGHDGKEWFLGSCCWDPPKVRKAPIAVAPEPYVGEPVPNAVKDDVADFNRPPAKKRKRA